MPHFFIDRPIFAWVVAIAITLAGILAIPRLPVERFPSIAPPSVMITATYPGVTPQTMNDSVIGPIERELAAVKDLLYFESSSDTSGSATITVTFKPGTDLDMAQVDVQNRVKTVEPRLPQVVRENGLTIESASSSFLLIVALESQKGSYDQASLGDYMARNIIDELKRVKGVGRVQLFGAEKAMRVWVSPKKLTSYNLTMSDVTEAIAQQNIQIAPGALGGEPTVRGQKVATVLNVEGQLTGVEQFSDIILRAREDGSKVTMGDVARVELGPENFIFNIRANGKNAVGAAVMLEPGANAVSTAKAVSARMEAISKTFPSDIKHSLSFNTAPFVEISIEKVIHTLIEAMVLVFVVMFIFLQKVRYTLIPAIVVPIALMGTLVIMMATGFSVNVLTMFGMVLSIGIIVDDAIVVVESVERLMADEGLSPKEATKKAMKEITGAIIAITLVLSAIFIPMALSGDAVGVIYRQFSMSMAVSILFSAFLALSLTPALTATLLKPISGHAEKKGFFGWFDRGFDRLTQKYGCWAAALLRTGGRMMTVFAVILCLLIFGFWKLPSSFLPEEDQGYFMTVVQLPSDATAERTLDVVKQFEQYASTRPGIKDTLSILGYGFSGSGANAAMIFTILKDWNRREGATVAGEVTAATEAMKGVHEGMVMNIQPPAIDSLGNSSGFSLRLQDRSGKGHEALLAAQNTLLGLAAQSPVVTGVYPEGLPSGMNITLHIDRKKAQALSVPFTEIAGTLSAAMGSSYVNDFPNAGRMQQVIVQADAPARMQIEDVLKLYVRNSRGGMVPLSEVVTPVWGQTPSQFVSYNGYPAMRISGAAAPGYSSGAAMAEMERLAGQLPKGFAIEWTGQSLQEIQSGAQAPRLLALSILVVFLILAALYESWSIPVSVILVVPLGLIGALAAVYLRGMPNDVFFKVGLITIIGLSAKNAILIVEFARMLRDQGRPLVEATIEAARLRLRPILMTSLAFTLGVVPLMLAVGASQETQRAIGTGVFGGMLSATILAIFFVPVFFVVVMGAVDRFARGKRPEKGTDRHA